ncbi:hypothetical protein GII33_13155 [Gordonia pseudamarae]|jgi:YVTN family beta-propeller protein|uniref:YncE family protein n=1 Tax=Gordonia pseudamarae TaxID=2831662 RepID=A0ABX6IKA4_9ACTN|nr:MULTISPECIES: hypothetical protein [Gordonia]MBD0022990.1 hypothetical protein [Gordonia sp. (in: high G+C Gram-positive bacteria)]QHN26760.1 hypothetical protein GII33_13155 [Gordonia pseudamarae]QHN35653.1 hypothetical protein GII31_12985 [Gordonia pseudamarae]
MFKRLGRRVVVPVAVAATVAGGLLVAPDADAAPQRDAAARYWESLPAPTVPQQPGYRITGYNIGKGNYRGAFDQETGHLWLTNVSPMDGASESAILEVDPATMRLERRIQITQKAKNTAHGTIAAQYEIGVPKTGNTVWTTAAAVGEVNVWDKTSGQRLKNITGVPHAHGVVFAEHLGVAIVSQNNPGGLKFYDLKTFEYLGQAVMPRGDAKQDEMGAGLEISDDSATGATVTVTSYYSSLTQFRITRPGGKVVSKINWNTRQPGPEGHGSVALDTRRHRVYVNHLYLGLVQVYDLRTGRHLRDVLTGTGTNSMVVSGGTLYAANYFAGYISVIDQKTYGVTRLITTGLLPNQLLAWKPNTFLVIDKSSAVLDGGYAQNRGVDRIWKVRRI